MTAVRDNLRWGLAALLTLVAALLFTGCDNMQHERNVTDKARQPGDAAIILRTPPENTVARGARRPDDPNQTGYENGKPLAENPWPVTTGFLARGRERFSIYCAVCHGDDGYGQGIVVRRGFPPPPSYHDDRLREIPDGHLYDVMTRGYGVMLPFSDRLTAEDRWAVVAYVRALQLSQHATAKDLSASDRAQLSAP